MNHASKRAWRATNRSIKAIDYDLLAQISLTAPVLIVQGEHAVIRETNAVLAERFPGATNISIKDAAHFPWVERPEVFAKSVQSFHGRITHAVPA